MPKYIPFVLGFLKSLEVINVLLFPRTLKLSWKEHWCISYDCAAYRDVMDMLFLHRFYPVIQPVPRCACTPEDGLDASEFSRRDGGELIWSDI